MIMKLAVVSAQRASKTAVSGWALISLYHIDTQRDRNIARLIPQGTLVSVKGEQVVQAAEYKELLTALVATFKEMGFLVTHVNGHPKFPQPSWVQRSDEWVLPDVVAEDRSRGLIILGDVKTADAWNTEGAKKKLEILQTCANGVYVMVPDLVIQSAKARQRRERWRNVFYLSPSSKE